MKCEIAVVVVAFAVTTLFADIDHKTPSAQEKAAIEKALGVMTKVIESFANENWKPESDSVPDYETISGEPSVPMDPGLDFNRKFTVAAGSPLFQSKVLPVMTQLQKAADAQDFATMKKLGDQVNGTTDFTVGTSVNEPTVPSGIKLDVKGATLALEDTLPNEWDVYVAVGDWVHAVAGPEFLGYKFKNARNTPHVENIVFHFRTRKSTGPAADRIREILRTTDWSALNAGLTP